MNAGKDCLVIGTRGSRLALWQADHIAAELIRLHPGLDVRREIIVTTGDRFSAGPVQQVGGKAVWVKEIEEALLRGQIDLAVHSLKDVPGELPPGLELAVFPPRADARDAWVSRDGKTLDALPPGARVGTSSPRRACQLLAVRPDLSITVFRGNVDTRLRKLADGEVDATVLACAGLDRLGLGQEIVERLAPERMVPAIGQGVLAIEVRADDARAAAAVKRLHHQDTAVAVAAERALLAGLGGSCRTPIAGHAVVSGSRVHLTGLVGRPDGTQILRAEAEAATDAADALGHEIAARLKADGADRILEALG